MLNCLRCFPDTLFPVPVRMWTSPVFPGTGNRTILFSQPSLSLETKSSVQRWVIYKHVRAAVQNVVSPLMINVSSVLCLGTYMSDPNDVYLWYLNSFFHCYYNTVFCGQVEWYKNSFIQSIINFAICNCNHGIAKHVMWQCIISSSLQLTKPDY